MRTIMSVITASIALPFNPRALSSVMSKVFLMSLITVWDTTRYILYHSWSTIKFWTETLIQRSMMRWSRTYLKLFALFSPKSYQDRKSRLSSGREWSVWPEAIRCKEAQGPRSLRLSSTSFGYSRQSEVLPTLHHPVSFHFLCYNSFWFLWESNCQLSFRRQQGFLIAIYCTIVILILILIIILLWRFNDAFYHRVKYTFDVDNCLGRGEDFEELGEAGQAEFDGEQVALESVGDDQSSQ